MLGIAEQIGDIDESQLNVGKARVEQIFPVPKAADRGVALTIGLGVLLAAFSIRKILALEKETARHLRTSAAQAGTAAAFRASGGGAGGRAEIHFARAA